MPHESVFRLPGGNIPTPNCVIARGLRRWAPEDRELLHRLLGDPWMTTWIGGPETAAEIDQRHDRYLAQGEPSDGQMLAVVLSETGDLDQPDIGIAFVGEEPRRRDE